MNRFFSWPVLLLMGASSAATAQVTHVDILVFEQDGKLGTGRSDFDAGGTPDGGVPTPDTRVFSREFDLVFSNLRAGDDPGFNSTPDFTLPANQPLHYRTVPFTLPTDSASRNLWYWDGVDDDIDEDFLDDVDFGAPPTGVEFSRFSNGNRAEIADGSDTTLPYVFIQDASAGGIVHKHLTWGVAGDGFQSIGVGGSAPPDGLYLVSFEFSIGGDSHDPLTDPENSEPIYLAFNSFADPLAEAAAAEWLNTQVIPAPGPTGDYNADGFVSQGDLDLVLLNWGDAVVPAGFDEAALDGGGPFDGLISQNELDGVLLNWGDGTPPNSLAVPEPGSAAALAVLSVAALRRRRA